MWGGLLGLVLEGPHTAMIITVENGVTVDDDRMPVMAILTEFLPQFIADLSVVSNTIRITEQRNAAEGRDNQPSTPQNPHDAVMDAQFEDGTDDQIEEHDDRQERNGGQQSDQCSGRYAVQAEKECTQREVDFSAYLERKRTDGHDDTYGTYGQHQSDQEQQSHDAEFENASYNGEQFSQD